MAYNPFLSMAEPAAAPVQITTEVLNPFMMTDAEPVTFAGDNPFAASNPFSDFGGGNYEPVAGDTVPLDIFGNAEPSGGSAKLFDGPKSAPAPTDIFGTSTPPVKPTELDLTPAPPTRPLPPETQSLILSVTGQMEVASSHLLDRIPPTRTPSPVSARDLHSPSPTPEPELELDPEPEPQPLQEPAVPDGLDINRNRPARPPPARPPPVPRPPPPRPAPPPVLPPQPVLQQAPPPQDDDINLFDAPAPTVVKPTKEAILSLYATKKEEEKPIDFLSDDILESIPVNSSGVSAPTVSTTNITSDLFPESGTNPPTTVATPESLFASETAAPMDCSEPPPLLPARQTSPQATTKVSPTSSPFADVSSNNSFAPIPTEVEGNPFQDVVSTDIMAFTNHSTNIFAATTADNSFAASSENVFITTATDTFVTTSINGHSQKDTFGGNVSDAFDAAAHDQNMFDASESDAFPAAALQATDPGWGAPAEPMDTHFKKDDAFDDFSAKFESAPANYVNTGAWGEEGAAAGSNEAGFESEAFDPFLSMGAPPPPAATPRFEQQGSRDSTDDSFSVFIRPKEGEVESEEACVPALAPPPRPQTVPDSPRANPFDKSAETGAAPPPVPADERRRSGSETPPTPLFDEDTSVPLEDFPRTKYDGPGWEMQLRQPNKKKITGQRFWKKIFVRMAYQGDNPVVQLLNSASDKEPFQELPLQACYSVSEVGAQQYDQFGKIFTVKLQYVFYKERPGVRPGQVTKAERITNKLSQFAAYAIQGDYQGVKEFGSDLRKLGLPVEHAPQVSQLFKIGSLSYEDVKQFSCCVEEALFRLPAHRDRALTYKMEEVQLTAVDELYVEQDAEGAVTRQIARVRLFFLGFLSGMPDVELGVNDLRRQGREVVGRHDIIPVVTEEWIRVENAEFHACVQPEEFEATQIIKFKPPDACYIELMRFRVRPPKNRELPLQLKAVWIVTGNKVELRADVLVPGFASRKLGQVPCEDVAIRFPIPECWIYLFRVEKHFRYGSVKSAHRRTGKIKGIERFLGAVDTLSESLIEVTSGQAKYEHQHRAIVWRMPRLPKEGQGAYTTHNLVCRMALTSYDQVPAQLAAHAHVEFTMPATQVSHMTVRSVSLQQHDGDPPEKYVRYLARHEYLVGIERTSGQAAPAYALAAAAPAPAPAAPPEPAAPAPPSSDSDSD